MTIWTVPGVVKRVIDADTIAVDLDLGWNLWMINRSVRLTGINAPELSTPEGEAAAEYTRQLLPLPCEVTVTSKRLDKYGRVEGHVRLPSGADLGTALVTAGHAHVVM